MELLSCSLMPHTHLTILRYRPSEILVENCQFYCGRGYLTFKNVFWGSVEVWHLKFGIQIYIGNSDFWMPLKSEIIDLFRQSDQTLVCRTVTIVDVEVFFT